MRHRFIFVVCYFLTATLLIPSFAASNKNLLENSSDASTDNLNKMAAEITSSIPASEFGGCYIENGKLIVCLKEGNQVNLANTNRSSSGSISIKDVQYSLDELEEVVDILIPNMDRLKIATIDADEVKNKVCIELYEDNDDIYEFIESNQLLTADAFVISVLEGELKSTVLEVSPTYNPLSSELLNSIARSSQTIYPGSIIMCGSTNNIVYATAGPRISNNSFYTAGHIYSASVTTHLYGYSGNRLTEMGTLGSHTLGSGGDYGVITVNPLYVSLPTSN